MGNGGARARCCASSISRAIRRSTRCSTTRTTPTSATAPSIPFARQGNIYLTTGSALRSNLGATMLTIVEDTCGRHDTLGGACSAESNTVRYALEKRHMHSCRDNFLLALAHYDYGLSKRDLPSNINFFMNVPVTPRRRPGICRRHLGAGSIRGDACADGRAGADLQLPAAQQSLQRLQSDTDTDSDLGGGLNFPSDCGTTRSS